ncbi:MAG TPA: hypothetical protein VGK48_24700 [Terriglobia bacterium]|jgi:hypothetical protein
MSKNPSDRQRMHDNVKSMKKEEQPRQTEAQGQDKKKKTMNFDEGQKFTSDEDITKRRTA